VLKSCDLTLGLALGSTQQSSHWGGMQGYFSAGVSALQPQAADSLQIERRAACQRQLSFLHIHIAISISKILKDNTHYITYVGFSVVLNFLNDWVSHQV